MKKLFFFLAVVVLTFTLQAQSKRGSGGTKKNYNYGSTNKSYDYGTSTNSGKTKSGSTFKQNDPTFNNTPNTKYKNGGEYKTQGGYIKSDGKYVNPHIKTGPDNYKTNNKGYKPKYK